MNILVSINVEKKPTTKFTHVDIEKFNIFFAKLLDELMSLQMFYQILRFLILLWIADVNPGTIERITYHFLIL